MEPKILDFDAWKKAQRTKRKMAAVSINIALALNAFLIAAQTIETTSSDSIVILLIVALGFWIAGMIFWQEARRMGKNEDYKAVTPYDPLCVKSKTILCTARNHRGDIVRRNVLIYTPYQKVQEDDRSWVDIVVQLEP